MRALAVSLVVLSGLVGMMGSAQSWSQFAESERYGVIRAMEPNTSSLVVSGLRYQVAIDAHVEIDGTYGAYSMLREGMKVRFVCQVVSGTERIIVSLETLPAGYVIEEA